MIASNDVPTQGIHVLKVKENGNWSSTFSKAIMVNPALSTKHKISWASTFGTTTLVKAQAMFFSHHGDFNQAIEQGFESNGIPSSLIVYLIFVLKTKTETGDRV